MVGLGTKVNYLLGAALSNGLQIAIRFSRVKTGLNSWSKEAAASGESQSRLIF